MLSKNVQMLLASFCFALTASAEPISYQGQLNDGGVPANGIYDIKFQLFDALTGGTQVGPTIDVADVLVVGGVFNTEIDFGEVFNADDLWLRIAVRPGELNTFFTELLPRQPLLQVPKASFATMAATTLDSVWEMAAADSIRSIPGIQNVLINRDTSLVSNSFFSVHAPTSAFGGMTVSTDPGGSPYYGFGHGNSMNAYTTYRESDELWRLWIEGQFIFRVDSEGDVSADGDVDAASFNLNAPRTMYYSVSGDTFHSGSNSNFFGGDAVGGAYPTQVGGGWLMAPVNLPHGAVVTALHMTYLDNTGAGDMTVALHARTDAANLLDIALVSTSGQSTAVRSGSTFTVNDGVIDNATRGYHLRAFSSNWPGNLLLRIFGVRIEYTVEEVQ
jgi:hypothetical protein